MPNVMFQQGVVDESQTDGRRVVRLEIEESRDKHMFADRAKLGGNEGTIAVLMCVSFAFFHEVIVHIVTCRVSRHLVQVLNIKGVAINLPPVELSHGHGQGCGGIMTVSHAVDHRAFSEWRQTKKQRWMSLKLFQFDQYHDEPREEARHCHLHGGYERLAADILEAPDAQGPELAEDQHRVLDLRFPLPDV